MRSAPPVTLHRPKFPVAWLVNRCFFHITYFPPITVLPRLPLFRGDLGLYRLTILLARKCRTIRFGSLTRVIRAIPQKLVIKERCCVSTAMRYTLQNLFYQVNGFLKSFSLPTVVSSDVVHSILYMSECQRANLIIFQFVAPRQIHGAWEMIRNPRIHVGLRVCGYYKFVQWNLLGNQTNDVRVHESTNLEGYP